MKIFKPLLILFFAMLILQGCKYVVGPFELADKICRCYEISNYDLESCLEENQLYYIGANMWDENEMTQFVEALVNCGIPPQDYVNASYNVFEIEDDESITTEAEEIDDELLDELLQVSKPLGSFFDYESFEKETDTHISFLYVEPNTTLTTSGIVLHFKKGKVAYQGKDGYSEFRDVLSIYWKDGFDKIDWIPANCEGEYAWCVRNEDNVNIAYISFTRQEDYAIVKVKYDDIIYEVKNSEEFLEHLSQVQTQFFLVE